MTVYELAKTLPSGELGRLTSAGIVGRSIQRQLYIYERYVRLVDGGMAKMQAYTEISEECYTSEENVRKIIQKFCKVIE